MISIFTKLVKRLLVAIACEGNVITVERANSWEFSASYQATHGHIHVIGKCCLVISFSDYCVREDNCLIIEVCVSIALVSDGSTIVSELEVLLYVLQYKQCQVTLY